MLRRTLRLDLDGGVAEFVGRARVHVPDEDAELEQGLLAEASDHVDVPGPDVRTVGGAVPAGHGLRPDDVEDVQWTTGSWMASGSR